MTSREMKILYNKFDKRTLVNLPVVQFDGRIIVIQTVGEARRAVQYLQRFPRLGIDTETRPTFRPGGMNPVALLQISTYDTCFLFRLNLMGLPSCVADLLANPNVVKVGLSLHDDWAQLHKRSDFKPQAYIDIQDFVEPIGIQDRSLQKLFANFFGQKISKSQRLSNWEADVLSLQQKHYAAIDAWACLLLYDEILSLRTSGQYRLVDFQPSGEEQNAT